jgi:hypothetical protein
MQSLCLKELKDNEIKKILKQTGYSLSKDTLDWLIKMAQEMQGQAIAMIENYCFTL